jgi:hypothetical protein
VRKDIEVGSGAIYVVRVAEFEDLMEYCVEMRIIEV